MFLLGSDDTLHGLAGTAFMRMLRQEDKARLPDFAGRRVRLASLIVELADRMPRRVLHANFPMVAIGERLSAAPQHWPSVPTLPRQISVAGPNRRACDGVRGCWAM